MFVICRLFGHKEYAFPSPVMEWRILGTYAALLPIYRCLRCGDEIKP